MPATLNTEQLKQTLIEIFSDNDTKVNGDITKETIIAEKAQQLTDAIHQFILSGTVDTTVTTTAGSGTGTGKLS